MTTLVILNYHKGYLVLRFFLKTQRRKVGKKNYIKPFFPTL